MAIVKDLARPESIVDPQIDHSDDPDKVYRLVSAPATDCAASIKASKAFLHIISGNNDNAADRYIKLYDTPLVPTSAMTPKLTITVPATVAFSINWEGLAFTTGLGIRMTAGAPDNDATALTLADITGLNITYE
jgi:hypothetical protein